MHKETLTPNVSSSMKWLFFFVQAQETYKDAVAAGQSAFLMEEDDEAGDVFECKVGNLPPHTQAQITFCYVTQLDFNTSGQVQFIYPCILRDRYSIVTEENSE